MVEEMTAPSESRTQLAVLKSYLGKDDTKQRFMEILGERANAYMASIVNVMANSSQLKQCEAATVMNAALIAATLDLPIDPNLGFAAIVPYGDKAQFQMMYRGFVQLAIRSGQYASMNVSEVYADEIKEYNPITGEIMFNDFSLTTMRREGDEKGIVGYYAWFRLENGFMKPLYMTVQQLENHGKKYSKSYQYDIKKGAKSSRWSIDKDAMYKKTVLKLLLSKWGIMSVQIQKAITFDQAVVQEHDGEFEAEHIDNEPVVHTPASSLDTLNQEEMTDGTN